MRVEKKVQMLMIALKDSLSLQASSDGIVAQLNGLDLSDSWEARGAPLQALKTAYREI